MRGSRKFCQRGSSTDNVFLKNDWMERGSNATKSGTSSARQRNAIELAFRLHADYGLPLNAGLIAL